MATMTTIETLQQCEVQGRVVKLPNVQLDRKIYVEVKNKLELIGGKWKGGSVSGFVFNDDPTDLLEQIANGENRNLKKEYQFFATPDSLADQLVELADIGFLSCCLEPSAGQGAIVRAIHRKQPESVVYGYEIMPTNQAILKKIPGFVLYGGDFLAECKVHFNRIIANPPFSKNQDIDHIRKMYDSLNPGGRLVSIASTHWKSSSNKKETEFREWILSNHSRIISIPAGAFKESGTNVETVIIVIDKR